MSGKGLPLSMDGPEYEAYLKRHGVKLELRNTLSSAANYKEFMGLDGDEISDQAMMDIGVTGDGVRACVFPDKTCG